MSTDALFTEFRDSEVFEAPCKFAKFAFAEFVLDLGLYQLQRYGHAIHLTPKNFDLLAYLVQHRDRTVTKQELLDAVWANVFVSESVLPRCIHEIRRVLGDSSQQSRFVETVRGRGYRFIGRARPGQAACAWCGQTLQERSPDLSARSTCEENEKPFARTRPRSWGKP
jgi:DNA-binding winged helix-turn-helix (wHTH) protein